MDLPEDLSPASAPAGLTPGMRAMAALALSVAIAACALASYSWNLHQAASLQQSGFLPWPGAPSFQLLESTIDQLVRFRPYKAWYLNNQAGNLTVLFIADPGARALAAAIGLALAALFGLCWARARAGPQRGKGAHILLALAIIPAGAGAANLDSDPPTGFRIDLRAAQIATIGPEPQTTSALTSQTRITYGSHFSHSRHGGTTYYFGEASNGPGQTVRLFTLDSESDTQTLCNAIVTYLNSQGAML